MRLDRDVAGRLGSATTSTPSGPDADRDDRGRPCAAAILLRQLARENRTCRAAVDRAVAGAAPSAATVGRQDVHHRAADELRDEQVGGMLIDLGRRADLLQHAVIHDGDPVGQRHGLDLVVGDVDGGRVVLEVQPLQLGAHLLAQLGIERADRLVHQHAPSAAAPARGRWRRAACRRRTAPRAACRAGARSAGSAPPRGPCASIDSRVSPVARNGKAMFS